VDEEIRELRAARIQEAMEKKRGSPSKPSDDGLGSSVSDLITEQKDIQKVEAAAET